VNISLNSSDPLTGFLKTLNTTNRTPNGLNWGLVHEHRTRPAQRRKSLGPSTSKKQTALLQQAHELNRQGTAPAIFIVNDLNPRALSAEAQGFRAGRRAGIRDLTADRSWGRSAAPSLRAERSNPAFLPKRSCGLLRRFAPRNDGAPVTTRRFYPFPFFRLRFHASEPSKQARQPALKKRKIKNPRHRDERQRRETCAGCSAGSPTRRCGRPRARPPPARPCPAGRSLGDDRADERPARPPDARQAAEKIRQRRRQGADKEAAASAPAP